MQIYEREKKELNIPKSLGNFVQTIEGGTDPEEVREIAQEVVENALTAYDTTEVIDAKLEALQSEIEGEIPSLDGYATEQWVEDKGYLTEHQTLKTINGESLIGQGNIEIQGGGGDSNYLIVNSLDEIENPVEGMRAYVKAQNETPKEYFRAGTEWINLNQYFDFSTDDWDNTRCTDFCNWVMSIPEPIRNTIKWNGKIGPIKDASYVFYEGSMSLERVQSNEVVFNAMSYGIGGDARIEPFTSISLRIADNGLSYDYNNQLPDLQFRINAQHNLSTYNTLNSQKFTWLNFSRTIFNECDTNITLIYENSDNETLLFKPQVTATGYGEGNLIVDEVRDNVRYEGEWFVNADGAALVSWGESPVGGGSALVYAENPYPVLSVNDGEKYRIYSGSYYDRTVDSGLTFDFSSLNEGDDVGGIIYPGDEIGDIGVRFWVEEGQFKASLVGIELSEETWTQVSNRFMYFSGRIVNYFDETGYSIISGDLQPYITENPATFTMSNIRTAETEWYADGENWVENGYKKSFHLKPERQWNLNGECYHWIVNNSDIAKDAQYFMLVDIDSNGNKAYMPAYFLYRDGGDMYFAVSYDYDDNGTDFHIKAKYWLRGDAYCEPVTTNRYILTPAS